MNNLLNVVTDTDLFEKRPHGNKELPVEAIEQSIELAENKTVPWHWHPEIEINIVLEGEADFMSGPCTVRLKKGQGILINANIMHSVRGLEGTGCLFRTLIFSPAFIQDMDNMSISVNYVQPILFNSKLQYIPLFDIGIEPDRSLLSLANHAIDALLNKDMGYELEIKGNLCIMWALLVRHFKPSEPSDDYPSNNSKDDTRIKTALLFIKTHYSEQITLDDVANEVNISKSECCRCFNRTLNLSPIDYLIRYRIYQAARLIITTKDKRLSVSDIALSVGFNNISYFNKMFKQYTSFTPKALKKALLNEENIPESLTKMIFPTMFYL